MAAWRAQWGRLGDDRELPGPATSPQNLANVAVAEHHGDLAADERVGCSVDAIDQRVAATVFVIELALGDRVVDVDGRERSEPSRCMSYKRKTPVVVSSVTPVIPAAIFVKRSGSSRAIPAACAG